MYLLDTNHCSAIIFGDPVVITNVTEAGVANLAISAITEGELLYMAENSNQIEENLVIIKEFLVDMSVYDVDSGTSCIYAKLKAQIMNQFAPKERSKRRKTRITDLGIGENDLWIASIAIQNNLTVVSADRDFKRIQEPWAFPLETWYADVPDP
jgi:tRNA(fMet)-specific endonuclease VapC